MAINKGDLSSASQYDADAPSLHMASDQASDSEDDQLLDDEQITYPLNEHDRTVLKDEEETEKLLSNPTRFDAVQNIFKTNPHEGQPVKASRRDARRQRRREKRRSKRGRSNRSGSGHEVMYEMEEGWKDTSSQNSANSSSAELSMAWDTRHRSKSRRPSRFPLIGFHTLVIILFFALAYGAYHASTKFRKVQTSFTLSNGTHLFAPTTILISLDGFRADFLNRGLTPTLNEFISQGVSPRYMLPSFPSVTFPNHFTMVTGLYPESHGIVSNTFWDPDLKEEFVYTNKASSMQSKWWNAEPLWVTAEKQGVRTAVHMWPGSEAHIPPIEPTYVDQYNGAEELNRKVDRILGWLDLPGDADHAVTTDLRPQLIAAYVPNVDADGHLYGPNSTEIRATISQVDSMLADLFHGLYDRNLTSVVNIVIVSDHGMATTSNERLVQLDDLIDLDLVEHIDGWPLRGLRLKHPEQDLQPMYERLVAESAKSDGFEVYTRDNMPARYHFSNNDRIAPLWVIPKAGWAIVERNDFDIVQAEAEGRVFRPKGIHGYDHEHPLMRAIAVMRGPSFPHKPNSQVPIFQNTEVYNIVCDSVGIMPHLNNGSLRLPLKPIGFHDSPIPDTFDPPPSDVEDNADTSSDVHDAVQPTEATGEGSPSDVEQETPSQDSEQGQADEDTSSVEGTTSDGTSWLDFFKDRLEKAKQWANSVLENLKNNGWHEAEAEDSSGS